MICPNCHTPLQQDQLVKANVRGFENVDLVYDTLCPFCHAHIGQMFWGKLTLYTAHGRGESIAPPAAEYDPIRRPAGVRICPHCGEPLPDNLEVLPLQRRPQDRRTQDRRHGEDRRKENIFWWEPERRKSTRRQMLERRLGNDRRTPRDAAFLQDIAPDHPILEPAIPTAPPQTQQAAPVPVAPSPAEAAAPLSTLAQRLRTQPAARANAPTPPAGTPENRQGDRRKNRTPVLYDRRRPGADRRNRGDRDKINKSI